MLQDENMVGGVDLGVKNKDKHLSSFIKWMHNHSSVRASTVNRQFQQALHDLRVVGLNPSSIYVLHP